MPVLFTSLRPSVCVCMHKLEILMSLFTFKLYSESLQICKLSAVQCGGSVIKMCVIARLCSPQMFTKIGMCDFTVLMLKIRKSRA